MSSSFVIQAGRSLKTKTHATILTIVTGLNCTSFFVHFLFYIFSWKIASIFYIKARVGSYGLRPLDYETCWKGVKRGDVGWWEPQGAILDFLTLVLSLLFCRSEGSKYYISGSSCCYLSWTSLLVWHNIYKTLGSISVWLPKIDFIIILSEHLQTLSFLHPCPIAF